MQEILKFGTKRNSYKFTTDNIHNGPSMISHGKTPWKDPLERPLGKTPGVFPASVGAFHLQRPFKLGVFPWDIIDSP